MSIHDKPPIIPDQVPQTEADRAEARQTVRRSTPETPDQPRVSRRALMLGGGILAAVATVGSIVGLSGDDKDPGKTTQPAATASATPGETAPAPTESPEAVVGQAGSTLENISVKPSQELIDEALQPVTVAEYPTPEAALEQMSKIENIIYLSGTVETESGSTEFPETEESLALADQLWSNILSEEGKTNILDGSDNLRRVLAMELWFLNESANAGKQVGTWHQDAEVKNTTTLSKSDFTAIVQKTNITNFLELDPKIENNLPGIAPVVTFESEVTLHNDGVRWYIDDRETFQ